MHRIQIFPVVQTSPLDSLTSWFNYFRTDGDTNNDVLWFYGSKVYYCGSIYKVALLPQPKFEIIQFQVFWLPSCLQV